MRLLEVKHSYHNFSHIKVACYASIEFVKTIHPIHHLNTVSIDYKIPIFSSIQEVATVVIQDPKWQCPVQWEAMLVVGTVPLQPWDPQQISSHLQTGKHLI